MNAILEILKQHKPALMAKYPIKTLSLFGSYSRGDNTKDSDIDILVELTEPIGMAFIQMANDLEDIFHKKVDLVSKNGVKPKYMPYIQKDLQYV